MLSEPGPNDLPWIAVAMASIEVKEMNCELSVHYEKYDDDGNVIGIMTPEEQAAHFAFFKGKRKICIVIVHNQSVYTVESFLYHKTDAKMRKQAMRNAFNMITEAFINRVNPCSTSQPS